MYNIFRFSQIEENLHVCINSMTLFMFPHELVSMLTVSLRVAKRIYFNRGFDNSLVAGGRGLKSARERTARILRVSASTLGVHNSRHYFIVWLWFHFYCAIYLVMRRLKLA